MAPFLSSVAGQIVTSDELRFADNRRHSQTFKCNYGGGRSGRCGY